MARQFVHINVSTGNNLPTGVTGLPGADKHDTDARYESTMVVSGQVSGQFRLSIFPDDMNVKGRTKDGIYPIFLGFHTPKRPTASDLEVRTNGFRPVIVIKCQPACVGPKQRAQEDHFDRHPHPQRLVWLAEGRADVGRLSVSPPG